MGSENSRLCDLLAVGPFVVCLRNLRFDTSPGGEGGSRKLEGGFPRELASFGMLPVAQSRCGLMLCGTAMILCLAGFLGSGRGRGHGSQWAGIQYGEVQTVELRQRTTVLSEDVFSAPLKVFGDLLRRSMSSSTGREWESDEVESAQGKIMRSFRGRKGLSGIKMRDGRGSRLDYVDRGKKGEIVIPDLSSLVLHRAKRRKGQREGLREKEFRVVSVGPRTPAGALVFSSQPFRSHVCIRFFCCELSKENLFEGSDRASAE